MAFKRAKVGLDAGKLNHRISIQKQGGGQDADGGIIEGWQEEYKCWASILDRAAFEKQLADEIHGVVDGAIIIRYTTNIAADYRAVHPANKPSDMDGTERVYNIKGVVQDTETQREWLSLPYTHGKNDG